jgi:hypothetical protein
VPPVPAQVIPIPPDRDPLDLARRLRLRREQPVDSTPRASPPTIKEGDQEEMWVLQDSGGGQRVQAVARRLSEHAVWLFGLNTPVEPANLDHAVRGFEEQIWPRVTGLFGDLGGPGLNGDPRITIFHTDLEAGLAGYYSSSDEFPSEVHPFSNGRKIIYVDARKLAVGSSSYMNVLAHELQHAVHYAADPGEDTWINEGLSEVAVDKAGFAAQSVPAFLANPNVQLNVWPDDPETGPHYGGAMLFGDYLIQHYGGDREIRRLVAQARDGLDGVDAYLAQLGFRERALDVFGDWVIANYADEDGTRYGYSNRKLGPLVSRMVSSEETITGQAAQMGASYFVVRPGWTGLALKFEGEPGTELFPVAPKSLRACWWSNQGDSIDSTLTREVDLTAVTSAVLRYSVWFGIEDEWDYAYVEASEDGGKTWAILEGLHTTRKNTNGAAFGPGYTGKSDGWLSEQIDLTRFAGKKVLLRLEYVTDDAVHLQGICFDDFEIRELGWFDFAESDRDWKSDGFARVSNAIPQTWLVQVLRTRQGSPLRVTEVPVGPSGDAEFRLDGVDEAETVVVVVSATTSDSMAAAPYTLRLSPIQSRPGE